MSQRPITTKKECPQCRSSKVAYQGVGTGAGTRTQSGKLPSVMSHKFKCNDCGLVFTYQGQL